MISIISGPTCIGKTYFIENKKDRILELSNLPPTTESYVTGSFSSNHLEFPDVVSHWIKRNDGGAIVDKIACIHHNRLTGPRSSQLINTYKDNADYFSKKVIILGVSYSEYKVRIFQRHDNFRNFRPSDIILDSNIEILEKYKRWIVELNKNEIPYKFVEASGDYKVLEEKEFFRMVK